MRTRQRIVELFLEVITQAGGSLECELTDDAVLLQTGLDSLGFAVLVTRLEDELGYDPFSLAAEPYYPVTFGDFVLLYEGHQQA